jgi:hypothetical protein
MGSGEFGSNGSVHWRVNHKDTGNPNHNDVDNSKKHPANNNPDKSVIGSGGKKNHPGAFRITARYATNAQAQEALAAAERKLAAGGTELELDVQLRPYDDVKNSPGPSDFWEIRVDW